MSNIKELIRAEIERLKSKYRHNGLWTSSFQSDLAMAKIESMNELLSFLDTMSDEPEQPTRGYDEAYLNEKIAKASKSWEGVDVDKFMDEVRGRESVTDYNELKKHTKEWVELMVGTSFPEQDGDFISEEDYRSVIKQTAIHFAEWQKRKMMEGAVEGVVCYGSKGAYVESDWLGTTDVEVYGDSGSKIRIIILPKED